MSVQRQDCEVQRRVGYARVRLEDGEDAEKSRDDEERLSPEARRESSDIAGQVKPENAEEECAEGIEHLDKEVPPQANVGSQVWNQEVEAVCRRHELPEIPSDEIRKTQQGCNAGEKFDRMPDHE